LIIFYKNKSLGTETLNFHRILNQSQNLAAKFSPDSNGNPFYFFFKNKKIAMDSWK
jgi:hypothetical protein